MAQRKAVLYLIALYAFWFFYTFYPIIVLYWGRAVSRIDPWQEVEAGLVGAVITASGIMTAFLTAVVVSKTIPLYNFHYSFLILTLLMFFFGLNGIFLTHIFYPSKPDFFDLGLVMTGFNSGGFALILFGVRFLFSKVGQSHQ